MDYNVMLNFDDSVLFSNIEQLPPFYKAMLECFNKAYVSDRVVFVNTIMNQPFIIWGNKFITKMTRGKKNVLFLRNWIRSGIRKVGDLVFIDGILDQNYIYQRLVCKQNSLPHKNRKCRSPLSINQVRQYFITNRQMYGIYQEA